jgi:hypothetical protein
VAQILQPKSDGVQAMALHTGWNTCVGFKLETPAGIFEAQSPIHFTYTVATGVTKLEFRFPRSEFIPPTGFCQF